MTTQKALKLEKKMNERDSLGNRSLMKIYVALGWWQRKMAKRTRQKLLATARRLELDRFEMTVHKINSQAHNQYK